MILLLGIECDNAAFAYGNDVSGEVARILDVARAAIKVGGATDGKLYDISGNRVGSYRFREDIGLNHVGL